MKPVAEWDEAYIMNLPPGEHDWLEFKNSNLLDLTMPKVVQDDVLNELAKQVSAFANSGGGTIVYGVEDKTKAISNGGIPFRIKGRTTAKEWLEDVIPRLVEFPLQKFNVYEVHNSSPSSNIAADKCLILVDIPDSDAAPHQSVRDKHYYARVGGKTVPISHRHVVDIMGRAKHPKIMLTSATVKTWLWKDGRLSNIVLQSEFTNVGKVYANYVNGNIFLPSNIAGQDKHFTDTKIVNDKVYRKLEFNNIHQDLIDTRDNPKWGRKEEFYVTRYNPILPKLSIRVGILLAEELFSNMHILEKEELLWEVYADNAPTETGIFSLKDVKQEIEKMSV